MSALEEIRNRAKAASPGPWLWRGNVDHDEPTLSWYKPGWGRVEVLRHYPRERTADDRGAKEYEQYLRDLRVEDGLGDDGKIKYRPYTKAEIAERVREGWLEDTWGNPQTDPRMAFADPKYMHALDARDLAIFEVCPEAISRDDARVYRADIIGVRHPDANFIAHSRQDVEDLLALVYKIRERAESWIDDFEDLTDEECSEGPGCPCCHARDILSLLGEDRPAVRPIVETVQVAGDVL